MGLSDDSIWALTYMVDNYIKKKNEKISKYIISKELMKNKKISKPQAYREIERLERLELIKCSEERSEKKPIIRHVCKPTLKGLYVSTFFIGSKLGVLKESIDALTDIIEIFLNRGLKYEKKDPILFTSIAMLLHELKVFRNGFKNADYAFKLIYSEWLYQGTLIGLSMSIPIQPRATSLLLIYHQGTGEEDEEMEGVFIRDIATTFSNMLIGLYYLLITALIVYEEMYKEAEKLYLQYFTILHLGPLKLNIPEESKHSPLLYYEGVTFALRESGREEILKKLIRDCNVRKWLLYKVQQKKWALEISLKVASKLEQALSR